jgi:hypothetical protein
MGWNLQGKIRNMRAEIHRHGVIGFDRIAIAATAGCEARQTVVR